MRCRLLAHNVISRQRDIPVAVGGEADMNQIYEYAAILVGQGTTHGAALRRDLRFHPCALLPPNTAVWQSSSWSVGIPPLDKFHA
jgi:hypothetical protein